MAILDSCPGLEVKILVDRRSLHEYESEDEPPIKDAVTKYIEAESGKQFAIEYTFRPPFPRTQDVGVKIFLDGALVRNTLYDISQLYRATGHMNEGPISTIGSKTFKLKYVFSALRITKDSRRVDKELLQKVSCVSTVKVTLHFVRNMRKSKVQFKNPGRGYDLGVGDAKSHQVKMTQPVVQEEHIFWTWDEVGDGPFATFNFKYRSLEALRALHILPRETTPVALEDRPEEDFSPEELRELVRRLKRNGATPAINQESPTIQKSLKLEAPTDVAGGSEDEVIGTRSRKKPRGGRADEAIVLD